MDKVGREMERSKEGRKEGRKERIKDGGSNERDEINKEGKNIKRIK